jgi:hypothetical protein
MITSYNIDWDLQQYDGRRVIRVSFVDDVVGISSEDFMVNQEDDVSIIIQSKIDAINGAP